MTCCREISDFLMAYLDGELPAEQREAFDKHLAACPPCATYLKSYEATVRLGKLCGCSGLPAAPIPENLVKAILEARAKKPT